VSDSSSDVRARAHPGAIATVWAWQAGVSFVVAWPAASLVRAVFGNDPRGDAPLWEPGATALLDFLWHNAGGRIAATDGALLVELVAVVAGLIPLGALMAAIARPRESAAFRHAVLAALRILPTFAKCAAVALGAQGGAIGTGALIAMLADGWTRSRIGEAPAQLLEVAIGLPFVIAALALGVAHDLARSVVVVRGAGAIAGLTGGLRLYRAAPARLSWSWTWRAVVSLAPVGVAALIAARAGTGVLAFVIVAVAHQGAVFARVALRASWLACTLRAASQAADSDR
jgi:hypothetical protein